MKHVKTPTCLVVLLFWLSSIYAQNGVFVDKDRRIAKFEKDIIIYLSKQTQEIKIVNPFHIQDYANKIFVRKCLEVYSSSNSTNVLLIQFSGNSDHSDRFWGILTNKEKYFFYNPDDTREVELSTFKKNHDPITTATIMFYCYQYEPGQLGPLTMSSGIFLRNLNVIKDALHNKEDLSIAKVDSAKLFLQRITSEKPESNRKNSGRFNLTSGDYTQWLNWFEKNKSQLYWDDKEQKVKVK